MDSLTKSVAIIVAHPDDETLWAGGTILNNPSWQCFIICLCRKSDTERAYKFFEALKILKAEGIMGDLDDGPEQTPLEDEEVDQAILKLLPPRHYDLIITHNPKGEYTRHYRHEEVSQAVLRLWDEGKISTTELWLFAYEDGNKAYYPQPLENATLYYMLSKQIWQIKYAIMTETYGFEENSWEAITTPLAEAFWKFTNQYDVKKWFHHEIDKKQQP